MSTPEKSELEKIDSSVFKDHNVSEGELKEEALEEVAGGTIYLTDVQHSDTTADDV